MKAIIEVSDLAKKFGQFVANDHLNFNVYQGEVFGFLGANGAGKTTAIRILSGLVNQPPGRLLLLDLMLIQSEKIKKSIGYMSQKFSLYDDLTVYENIRLFGGIYGLQAKRN